MCAFASLVLRAQAIKGLQNRLRREKVNTIKLYKRQRASYSLGDRFRHYFLDVKITWRKRFKRWFSFRKGSRMDRFIVKLTRNDTFENYILKSIVGFLGGFMLTYIFFLFFVFTLNIQLITATAMCAFFGIILTLGLAFSQAIRCAVFMILPEFFSYRGRQALLAYAFILTLSGPGKNTLTNLGIMSESLACTQEQLKQAARQILEAIKKPYYAIKEAVKTVASSIKTVVKKVKEIFQTIKRIVMGIVKVIKSVGQFLGKIFNICSKKVGTPFERCTRVFENAIMDCHAKLGPLFSWLCSITYLIQSVCYIVKPLDFICMLIEYIGTAIGEIMKKIRTFIRHIKTIFYVRIRFSHSFHFESIHSKDLKDVTQTMMNEIKDRLKYMVKMFNLINSATSLFFLVVIYNAVHYRYKYLTDDKFDNHYITRTMREIDFRRAQLKRETIFPLKHRENKKYIQDKSSRLLKKEKLKLSRSLSFLLSSTFKLATHLIVDYAIYWALAMIQYYGNFKTTIEVPRLIGINIGGKGFLADIYKSIVNSFAPLGIKMELDSMPCLPDPIPPDLYRYLQIGALVVVCWILAFVEPYGLRMRHRIMDYYYPLKKKARAIWLFNNICKRRQGFLKFARRQLRRKAFGSNKINKVTFLEWLQTRNCGFLQFFLGRQKQVTCFLCGEILRESDSNKPIFCTTSGCSGTYCAKCFKDIKNLCPICKMPADYGDMSDVDEEVDSSDNEALDKMHRKENQKEKNALKKSFNIASDDESETSDEEEDYSVEEDESSTSRSVYKTKRSRGGTDFAFDSDYASKDSDTESNYSYSYQYEKDFSKPQVASRVKFRDLEGQPIPDYVSMEIFSNETSGNNAEAKVYSEISSRSQKRTAGSLKKVTTSTKTNCNEIEYQNRGIFYWFRNCFFPEDEDSDSEVPLLDDTCSSETTTHTTISKIFKEEQPSESPIRIDEEFFSPTLGNESVIRSRRSNRLSSVSSPNESKHLTSTPKIINEEFCLRQYCDSEEEELFSKIDTKTQSSPLSEIDLNLLTIRNKNLFGNVKYHAENETTRTRESNKMVSRLKLNSNQSSTGNVPSSKPKRSTSKGMSSTGSMLDSSGSSTTTNNYTKKIRRYYKEIGGRNFRYRSKPKQITLCTKIKNIFTNIL